MTDIVQGGNKKTAKINEKLSSKDKKNKKKASDESEEEEEEFYTVEKILDFKKQKNRDYFLVKWEGYADPTWEPKSNLSNVRQLIDDFWKDHREKTKKTNQIDNQESSSATQETSEVKKQTLNGSALLAINQKKSLNSNGKEKPCEKSQKEEKNNSKKEIEDQNISISSTKGKKDDDEEVENQARQLLVKEEEIDEEKQNSSTLKKAIHSPQKEQVIQEKFNKLQQEEGSQEKKEKLNDSKKVDHDAQQQELKNSKLNRKRKIDDDDEEEEQQQQENKSQEQDNLKSIELLVEVKGNLEEHIPLDISKAIYKFSKFQYLVEWKQQKGLKVMSSLVSSEDLLQRYGDLIVRFYEEKALKRK